MLNERLIILISTALIATSSFADSVPSPAGMGKVLEIAHAIAAVQPRLPEPKYIEYAMGIYRAAKKYGVRPSLLIAITYQETSFREKLPEGRAGELGITQILKRWLNNPKFRAEFKNADHRTMRKPSKSFLYSAWILAELKQTVQPDALPYWSYYNAVSFEPRLRYYSRVNRHLEKIKRNQSKIAQRMEKLEDRGVIQKARYTSTSTSTRRWRQNKRLVAKTVKQRELASQRAKAILELAKSKEQDEQLKNNVVSEKSGQLAQQPGRWVPPNRANLFDDSNRPGT